MENINQGGMQEPLQLSNQDEHNNYTDIGARTRLQQIATQYYKQYERWGEQDCTWPACSSIKGFQDSEAKLRWFPLPKTVSPDVFAQPLTSQDRRYLGPMGGQMVPRTWYNNK